MALLLVSALVAVGPLAACGGDDMTETTTAESVDGVAIADFSYEPESITVPVGSSVTWTNEDSAAHTVTADGGAFKSGEIAEGETFEERLDEAGDFPYHCSIHSYMEGTVTVE